MRLEMPGTVKVADGLWHNITVTREGNMAILQVDYTGRISKNTGKCNLIFRFWFLWPDCQYDMLYFTTGMIHDAETLQKTIAIPTLCMHVHAMRAYFFNTRYVCVYFFNLSNILLSLSKVVKRSLFE